MIRVGQIGVVFTLTLKQVDANGAITVMNLASASGATDKQVLILRPDGTTLTKNASFVTDGTNGQIRATSAAGELNGAGKYRGQAYVKTTSFEGIVGDEGEFEFEVKANFTTRA